jgi:hypothetical protein
MDRPDLSPLCVGQVEISDQAATAFAEHSTTASAVATASESAISTTLTAGRDALPLLGLGSCCGLRTCDADKTDKQRGPESRSINSLHLCLHNCL